MVLNNIESAKKWIDDLLSSSIPVERISADLYNRTGLQWDVLRTDLIHPVCSGNKLFKLKYYLLDAIQKKYTMIHTEGGAWSNHIVATAYACQQLSIRSISSIHGDEPLKPSKTLIDARSLNMQLQFQGWNRTSGQHIPDTYFIPQGGYGPLGAKGAKEMLSPKIANEYTHIICAVGTGTMLAGLIQHNTSAKFIGIPVLKHPLMEKEIQSLTGTVQFELIHSYHMGGYAKKNQVLLDFMNQFYTMTQIPTDFVYTGKLMYAIQDLIQQDYFPEGSKILAIHSGGLQGNKSLTKGELIY